jgi:hypothetical protein
VRAFLLLLLAFTLTLPSPTAAGPKTFPQLALVAPAEVRVGDPFTVSVAASVPPSAGYAAFQSAVGLGGLTPPAASFAWSDCATPAGPVDMIGSYLLACTVAGPAPVTPSTYSGPLVTLTTSCITPGPYTLYLVPSSDVFGSYYLDEAGAVVFTEVGGPLTLQCKTACQYADLDGSGSVSVADIGAMVAAFGTASPLDRDGDSVVTVADIYQIVAQFGSVC